MSDYSAVSPNYYKGFTNGTQPIDITEHLTGNAAQAVQYLTRACRVDGVVKSDPIEDLEKAVWFTEREISRLKREQDSRTITGAARYHIRTHDTAEAIAELEKRAARDRSAPIR